MMQKYFIMRSRNRLVFSVVIIFLSLLFIRFVNCKKSIFFCIKTIDDDLINRDQEKPVGIYYKSDLAVFDTTTNIVHFVLVVNNHSSFSLDKDILENESKNKVILLSVEFFGNKYLRSPNDPLKKIINGSLDRKLEKIYSFLLSIDRKIYIRINPEMELWPETYPWQNNMDYIEAYRHVVLKWKHNNNNLKFV